VTYPNGLSSTFTYDDLNRLKGQATAPASYGYTFGPTGNRLSGVESSGRTLNWSYDGIYRLTSEVIGLDPHSRNGSVVYGLDPVGNRLSQTSSLPGISSGTFTFDANDRIATESYDSNGNALTSAGRTFTYDFENRLKAMNGGAVTLVYDGDGNRVAKTVSGATTRYLVDDVNPTGYAQVVEEVTGGAVSRTYSYGTALLSQNQFIATAWTPSFYGFDGAGTVRLLTNATGTVTDTYDYDAWGNLINATGSTPNVFLYRGEQYDVDLGLYYLRARYYNPASGRFLVSDPASGVVGRPASSHKYLYSSGDPVNRIDPTGWADSSSNGIAVGWTPLAGGYQAFSPSPLLFPQSPLFRSCVTPWVLWGAGIGLTYGGTAGFATGGVLSLPGAGAGFIGGVGVGGLAGVIWCSLRTAAPTASYPVAPPVPTPKPTDPCKDLQGKIYDAMNTVEGRVGDLLEDTLDLYNCAYDTPNPALPPGVGTYLGHIGQALGWQSRIRNLIDQARKLGCPIPSGALHRGCRPLPTQPRGN
jgi:RHS repeat-associated protein